MTIPNSTFTEIVSTTLRNRPGEFADNVTKHNALLTWLEANNKVKLISGGRTLVEELDYGTNSNAMFYNGYEVLKTAPQEVLSAAEFTWKQASVTISSNGLEIDVQNTGEEQVIDLVESRINNGMRSMANLVNEALYSDGTGYSGKEIGGLQLLVADDPTVGTVGGIDRSVSTNAFWRNKKFDVDADGSGAASSSNIQGYMNTLYLDTTRGTDKVDLILMSKNYYSAYKQSLQQLQRFSGSKEADLGFQVLKYEGADVVFEGSEHIPDNHAYFLNTDYLYFKTAAKRNFVTLDKRGSVNQDADVVPIVWAGNLTVSNASLQGVMFDAAA